MTVDIGIMFIKLMIKNKIITISKTRTITKTVMMIKKFKIVKVIKISMISMISMTSMTNKIIMTSITSIIIMTSMIHTKVTYNIKIIKEVETINNIMTEMIRNKIRELKMVIIKKDIRKITTTKNMNKMQIRQKTA